MVLTNTGQNDLGRQLHVHQELSSFVLLAQSKTSEDTPTWAISVNAASRFGRPHRRFLESSECCVGLSSTEARPGGTPKLIGVVTEARKEFRLTTSAASTEAPVVASEGPRRRPPELRSCPVS